MPYETHAASCICQPLAAALRVSSHTRRDLPTPGSPTSVTTWPRPVRARASARSSVASSAARPSMAVCARPAMTRRLEVTGLARLSSQTSTGSLRPLIGIGPCETASMKRSASRWVAAVMSVLPGRASCSMRAARCVVWPTAL